MIEDKEENDSKYFFDFMTIMFVDIGMIERLENTKLKKIENEFVKLHNLEIDDSL